MVNQHLNSTVFELISVLMVGCQTLCKNDSTRQVKSIEYLQDKILQRLTQSFIKQIYTILQNKRMRRCGVAPHQ